MSGGPTIVVKFGESVDQSLDQLFVVELDDTRNVDQDGEVKNQFFPGEHVWFLMHYDHGLRVTAIKTTSGEVFRHGLVSRGKTEEILFESIDDEHELPHNPAGHPSAVWYGRSSTINRSDRTLTAASTPCIGDVSYSYQAESYEYVPPDMTLAGDEEYKVGIVIWVEAA